MLSTPAEELLQHMQYVMDADEQEVEREKARAFIQFMTTMYASPSMGEEDAQFKKGRQDFLETIRPKSTEKKGPAKVYEWDEELIKRLAATQKGG